MRERTVALAASAVGSAFASGCTLPPPDTRQRADWSRGRRRYAVWLIEADTPVIRELGRRARERLAPWLGPVPQRQAHITLAACGFPVLRARGPGDFDAAQWRAQHDALRIAAPMAFALRIGGIGSFNGCPFLRVGEGGDALQRLHRLLAATIPQASGQRFVPHLTLGFYRQAVGLRDVAAAAAGFEGEVWLPVRAVTLAFYDPRTADSPLRYVLRVPLGWIGDAGGGTSSPWRGRKTGSPSTCPVASGC